MPILNWIGKDKVINSHTDVEYSPLDFTYSFKDGKDSKVEFENKIIHGDNLLALKSLLPQYQNKIKCIYIDPPYNTGNENWIYNDNVNDPKIKKWLGQVVGKESEDLSRHDKWLSMMYPRLVLLRELLSEDGAIFISIDDNEQANLKLIMDEIFGGGNFVCNLPTVMNLKGNQDQFAFAGTHEYTLVYVKNISVSTFKNLYLDEEEVDNWEQDEIGYFKKGANLKATGTNAPRNKRPNLFYSIFINSQMEVNHERISKSDFEILPITDNLEMSWRWSKEKLFNEKYNLIISKNNGEYSIYKKQRPELGELPSKKPKSIFYKPEYSSGNGTNQIKQLFKEKIFQSPKPLDLIKDFIQIATNENSIILDSFAGSGTTAHAVLNLNKQDGGNRKFILIEMEDYANTITAERVKRVIQGYGEGNQKVEATSGEFSYYTLSEPLFVDRFLNPNISIEKIREYIYFTETKDKISLEKHLDNEYFLGQKDSVAYYFYFEHSKGLTLDFSFLKSIKTKADFYIIYAENSILSKEFLQEKKIIFKQIPTEIYKV